MKNLSSDSLIVPKNVKGEPFGLFLKIQLFAKYQKNEERTFGDIQNFQKNRKGTH